MIDRATSAGMDAIAVRERDVLGGYRPGFVPESSDALPPSGPLASPDPLSVAAPQGTYFTGTDAAGGLRFTRDGSFVVGDGALCEKDGRPVLGFALGNRSTLVALRIDRYDAALGRVADPRIEADGTFGYTRTSIDPRSGARRSERVVVGRLALARFPAATQPVRVNATHVAPPPGVSAQIGVPGDAGFARLVPHARDAGGIDVVAGLEKMREAYESFDALRAAQHVRGGLEKTVMDLLK